MKLFQKRKLYSICGNGSYEDIVDYLKGCVGGEKYLAKYRRIFEGTEYVLLTTDERIKDILRTYEDYLKYVLTTKGTIESRKKYIVECFRDFFPAVTEYEEFEQVFSAYFKKFGYFVNFGVTKPFPTLYLWKTQNKREIEVELPETTVMMNVYEMADIMTRGWYSYLTFDKVGAGGWVSDDGCYYFKGKYKLNSEDFQISLLKHEGQHFHDLTQNPDMPSTKLEYRAKLVELVYLRKRIVFNSFLDRMGDDPENPHTYANKQIISALSKRIFSEELVTDKKKWRAAYQQVAPTALKLLQEDTLHQNS